ncbi:MAG: hypothetical protein RMN52_08870 [Anaerolineae bacterium]|nr:hypothetical protein [Candidatus Roseilinea sp.]MDW8450103.1 hypothetical protein [Anaerolineae bacterium]
MRSFREIGRIAAQTLIAQIEGRPVEDALLKTKLVVRASVARRQ